MLAAPRARIVCPMKPWLPFVFFVAPVVAQANWSLQSAAGLGQREGHRLVYDPATQRTFSMWGTTYISTYTCSMWNGSS